MAESKAIATIISSQWSHIVSSYNSYEIRVLDAIRKCRTSSLGGHEYYCSSCKSTHIRYNSCRNRHCSQCQNTQKEEWIAAREEQLIHSNYYHLVFTIPHELNGLFMGYKRQFYTALFRCAWETIHQFGWNNKYIGGMTGATMVLHTWGSNLLYHPHVHCIVPGGGISLSKKWKSAKGKGKYLFPIRALRTVFRAKMMEVVKHFIETEALDDMASLITLLYKKKWVVYAKPHIINNAKKVASSLVRYLARYTHNIAISHHRIISYNDESVTFNYKDYRHGGAQKIMTLSVQEFIRRFVQHILPKGFVRIRHYGILSSTYKSQLFPDSCAKASMDWQSMWESKGLDVLCCPKCKTGRLEYVRPLSPVRGPPKKKRHV